MCLVLPTFLDSSSPRVYPTWLTAGGGPDEKIIAAHWDDVLRLSCSVRTGVVGASLMLKGLGNYPRQNGLDLARLIFLDETWMTTNMARMLGRAPRGERPVAPVP